MPIFGLIFALLTASVPEGFADVDMYGDPVSACEHEARVRVPVKYRKQVQRYCEYRSFHSSRNKRVVSRIDGSWIHDRDRPHAWRFYKRGVKTKRLTPETCAHHRYDTDHKRPRKAYRKLVESWPYIVPVLTDRLVASWLKHPYDMERFGTRGPNDHNLMMAVRYVPGCYAPEALDRYDVSAAVTVEKAKWICECYGCKSSRDIRQYWRNPGWRCPTR
jgi:hypothetical protein